MEQLNAIAFALSLYGGMHDLLTRRIPNWLTFPAMLAGLVAAAWVGGLVGLAQAALGLGLGFVIFFPMHVFGYMGAGDVKLVMAVGAWMGGRAALQVSIAAVLLGAAYAFVEILYRGRMKAVALNTYYFLRALFVPGLVPEKLKVDERRTFAFGICIAGAVAVVIFLRHAGKIA